MNSNLSLTSSFAFEVGSLVHVAIDVTTYAGYGVGSGKSLQASVHGKPFSLQGLLEGTDTASNLGSFGMVSAEVLNFSYKCRVVLFMQGPIYKISELHALG